MEIACIEPGPRKEGKWPWGNFPADNPKYQEYLDENRLHCGDASDVDFLHDVWTNEMNRTDAPPLRIVVDDGESLSLSFREGVIARVPALTPFCLPPVQTKIKGAHVDVQMVQTVFFWFPRIAPRGLLVVEDIQPIQEANAFRTQFLPQIMKDLHFW